MPFTCSQKISQWVWPSIGACCDITKGWFHNCTQTFKILPKHTDAHTPWIAQKAPCIWHQGTVSSLFSIIIKKKNITNKHKFLPFGSSSSCLHSALLSDLWRSAVSEKYFLLLRVCVIQLRCFSHSFAFRHFLFPDLPIKFLRQGCRPYLLTLFVCACVRVSVSETVSDGLLRVWGLCF